MVAGDPRYDAMERLLAAQPPIPVPTIALDGSTDGVMGIGGTAHHAAHFTGPYEYRVIDGAGHNLPQEAPAAFADALLAVRPRA
jgi:pimeloyl-ACP methyl ester carboxylesterase